MRRRAIYWLFPLIALAVASFIVFFLIQINPSAPRVELSDIDEVLPPKDSSFEKSWIESLGGNSEKEFFYPVNELTLKLDDSEMVDDTNLSSN